MSTFSMLVPRKLGYPQTISTKIMFLSSISEICTSTTLISSTMASAKVRIFFFLSFLLLTSTLSHTLYLLLIVCKVLRGSSVCLQLICAYHPLLLVSVEKGITACLQHTFQKFMHAYKSSAFLDSFDLHW